ncbi:MAG TPA: AAA family ATPase [Armatimonadota bacterium]|nr:AAA family ATPase [Armatimonadota bacterium]
MSLGWEAFIPVHLKKIRLLPDCYPAVDCYPFNVPALRETREIPLTTPVTFFVGENGTGKSTLLEAVARRCGIHIWTSEYTPRMEHNPHEEKLHLYMAVEWTAGSVPGSYFSARIFRTFAEMTEVVAANDPGQLRYYGGKSLLSQSHGQSLLSYFGARYQLRGLHFLDEPETALSPRNQIQLLRLLRDMARAGHAQFLVATHSPILLACPGATLYSLDSSPIQAIAYEETEHYRLCHEFMADPQAYLASIQ